MLNGYVPTSEEMQKVSDTFSQALKALGGRVRSVEVRYNPDRGRIEIDTYVDTGHHTEDGFAIGQEIPDAAGSAIENLLMEPCISESPLGTLLRNEVYLDGIKF